MHWIYFLVTSTSLTSHPTVEHNVSIKKTKRHCHLLTYRAGKNSRLNFSEEVKEKKGEAEKKKLDWKEEVEEKKEDGEEVEKVEVEEKKQEK